jgi:hypothetical protein
LVGWVTKKYFDESERPNPFQVAFLAISGGRISSEDGQNLVGERENT